MSLYFYGFPSDINPLEWKEKLDNFGYVTFFAFNTTLQNGYVIYNSSEESNLCKKFLHGTHFPEDSSSTISVVSCSNDDINFALRNYEEDYIKIDITKQSTYSNLYRKTSISPPIFWSERQ